MESFNSCEQWHLNRSIDGQAWLDFNQNHQWKHENTLENALKSYNNGKAIIDDLNLFHLEFPNSIQTQKRPKISIDIQVNQKT